MSHPSFIGRHYRSGTPVAVTVADDCIQRISAVAPAAARLPWIAPGLVDLQVNGFGGVDFQSDSPTEPDVLRLAASLHAAGVTRCLPTLITDEWATTLHKVAHWRDLAARLPAFGRLAAGWHLEGPFLSPEAGFRGAHDPRHMRDPDPALLPQLRGITGNDPVVLTLAPERPRSCETIQAARRLGFRVSLGHTNANANELAAALEAGATGFTHLGNACPQDLDRHDNILWRVLDLAACSRLTVSLIPDGHHVSPALFRLIHRTLPASRVFYVSDAMSAASARPGRYKLGPLELETATDGVVRLPGTHHFAGSSLRPIDGVFRAASMLSQSWRDCWDSFSVEPARWMGWKWGLTEGAPADLCLLDWNGADEGAPAPSASGLHLRVVQAGHEVHQGLVDG